MAGGDLMFARRTGSFFSLAWFAGASLALVSFLLLVGESRAMELISAQEAGLPEDPSGRSYGISLGPAIIVLNPSPAAGSQGERAMIHAFATSPTVRSIGP